MMSAMLSVVDEALPRESATRRPRLRGSLGDRPNDEGTIRGRGQGTPDERREHLPRVLNGVRALVVDDDEDNMELFSAALTACGATVATASRAGEALRLLAMQPFDIVVSDIAMPGGDGYWLIRQVRQLADERARGVPLLAVTAFGREHSRMRSLAAGFVDHLQKPVDPELLCRTVARLLGR
jgi:CheY-like chemotaxis protein